MKIKSSSFLPRTQFDALIKVLSDEGYRCIGPRVKDGAIVYADLTDASTLPRGISDHQSPGRYRLEQSDSPRWFSWANGPQALKPLTFTPQEILWEATRDANGSIDFKACSPDVQPIAVIGARACDLAALALQRQHFLDGHPDAAFRARSEQLFIVAVHCHHPADTCFCASTGDGPAATHSFDIAFHELDDGFLLETGSEAGEAIAAQCPLSPVTETLCDQAKQEIEAAAAQQTRNLPAGSLQATLFSRLDHPRWEEVGERCLSCGNCTAVCPTCFCNRQEDQPSLDGLKTQHIREWDSCFTSDHSYIHGLVIRSDTRSRYRQWMTHKLGSWHAQYGRSGCVGCGRCISWCPVGIDITEEAHAIVAD